MKRWQKILMGVVLAIGLLASYVYTQLRVIEVEALAEDLWVLRGLGGNTSVLRTDAGAVIVDTMTFPLQGQRIRETARSLTGTDAVLIVNTHYHLDHTHGNPAFDAGTRVLSTERTRAYMEALDSAFWSGEKARLMPNETFADRQTLLIGGKTLELLHPGRAHTDGDLVVLFTDERVVAMGDLLFNDLYPNIDLEAGGSVQAWPQTLDRVSSLAFDRVVPGHGATTDREGIARFRAFMAQLGEIGREAAASGASKEETQASERLTADAGFEVIRWFGLPLPLDREFVLRRAWDEATGNVERVQAD